VVGQEEALEITFERCQQIIDHLENNNLDDADQYLVKRIICAYLEITKIAREKDINIHKLKELLFGEIRKKIKKNEIVPTIEVNNIPTSEFDVNLINKNVDSANDSKNKKPKKGNNGRNSARKYTGASIVDVKMVDLSKGDPCPLFCGGKVYPFANQELIRISGGEIATAILYQLERLRCNLCGALFSAKLPEGVGDEKYNAKFKACLCLHKYFLGTPWYRIEALQNFLGIPLPDSTQWHITEFVANCVYPIYFKLLYLAAQGGILFHDDTRVKILSVILENLHKAKCEKKGTHTTGIISKIEENIIYLFISSTSHGGKNMAELLKNRIADLPIPTIMSDALAANNLGKNGIEENRANCLAHGGRKFTEIDDFYPEESQIVVETITKVFEFDAESKAEKMNNEQRLTHHQKNSAPLLEILYHWMKKLYDGGLIEPTCSLGKALKYMLNHWTKLTRFLTVSGCPIDNNLVEAALKIPIRIRKNSMFYKTEHGAFVGSLITSIIFTAMQNGVNPIEYLTALQENKSQVFKEPEAWLPWNYQNNLHPLEMVKTA
jgi:hypothetical protein